MTRRWREQTGTFRVWDRDEKIVYLNVVSTFSEDQSQGTVLRDEPLEIVDEEWSKVTPLRGHDNRFAFVDAPDEILTVVDADEFRRAML